MNAISSAYKAMTSGGTASSGKPKIYSMYYWSKRRSNSKRIKWFFGRPVHLDVSVHEIRKYGLVAMLQSNIPLCYFLYYLLDNYCAENLFFFIEVEAFENHKFDNTEDMKRVARQLYQVFIREKSDFEVNLDSKVTKPIKKALESGDQHCFAEAKQAIYHLLEPSFVQFSISPIFNTMIQEIGENKTIYGREDRDAGVEILLKHLDKSLASEVDGMKSSDAAIAAERTRARLVRNLIHSFCKTRVGCDFWDKEDNQNLESIKPAQLMSRTHDTNPF